MFQIFDNFIPLDYQKRIETTLLAYSFFPWYYSPSAVKYQADFNGPATGPIGSGIDTPQMYHMFHNGQDRSESSGYFKLVSPFMNIIQDRTGLEIKELVRIKANLLFPSLGLGGTHIPHIDHPAKKHLSMIYYVNDSDGDTVFFDQYYTGHQHGQFDITERLTPKQGSAVLFNSDRFHASSLPVNTITRSVINFIFSYE
jgi:hypothetical protein